MVSIDLDKMRNGKWFDQKIEIVDPRTTIQRIIPDIYGWHSKYVFPNHDAGTEVISKDNPSKKPQGEYNHIIQSEEDTRQLQANDEYSDLRELLEVANQNLGIDNLRVSTGNPNLDL